MPKFIKIEKLKCVHTNDMDSDEYQLKILIDRSIKELLKMRLSEGKSRDLNQYYQFKNQVEVGLFDKDEQDNEDFLGLVNLRLEPVHQTLTVAFATEKGNYFLSYRIELEKPPELLSPPPFLSREEGVGGGYIGGIPTPPSTPIRE